MQTHGFEVDSFHQKTSLEVLDEDGVQRFIARDTIVQIVLIAHTRPAYIDDKELLPLNAKT